LLGHYLVAPVPPGRNLSLKGQENTSHRHDQDHDAGDAPRNEMTPKEDFSNGHEEEENALSKAPPIDGEGCGRRP
jgi:hypothetical protein